MADKSVFVASTTDYLVAVDRQEIMISCNNA